MEKLLDIYTDYLLCSTSQTSSTRLSALLDNAVSHDGITRLLSGSDFSSKVLWQAVKPLVREHQSADACLIFDDTIIEKAHMEENDLIGWHFDHTKGRSVKGINLLTAFYVTQKKFGDEFMCVPVSYHTVLKAEAYCTLRDKKTHRRSPQTKNEMLREAIDTAAANSLSFKYVLADTWFASSENMAHIASKNKFFIFDMKENRLAIRADALRGKPGKKADRQNIKSLDIAQGGSVSVWLKDMDFPVLLTKQVFKDEDGNLTGTRFLATNDFGLSEGCSCDIYQKRWRVEEYHKSLKQNASIAKSPARTVKTQSNHLFCALIAYVKLEKIKFANKLGHFEVKAKIYLKALKAAYAELGRIAKQTVSA